MKIDESLYWRQKRLPERYKNKTFDNFNDSNEEYKYVDFLKQCITDYPEKPIEIILFGCTGAGKTHLAIASYLELTKQGKLSANNFQFITAPEFLFKIRESYNPNPKEYESQIMDRYSECDFLILDDLGSEKTSEFAVQALYLLIDRRIRNIKPMIITTNLTLERIEEKLDARIASRLSGMKVVKINLPDYRKRR